jgi:hypothetical protein
LIQGARPFLGLPLLAVLSSSIPVSLRVRGLGTIHCHYYVAGVGGVIGVSSKAERYRQARHLCLTKSMARMVLVAAVVCAVVIIMQAPWGDGL